MRKQYVVVALVSLGLGIATSVRAQEAASSAGIAITPYLFLGSGSSSGVGVAARVPLQGPLSLELETSHRLTDVSPVSANLSLLFDFPEVGRVTPYVAGGIGLDQYVIADGSPAGNIVVQAKTAFSVNAGGGLSIRGDEHWGIRSDARWINGLGDRAPERWRVYNGVTFGGIGR